MREIQGDSVRFDRGFAVSFQRTLRVPDDGHSYPLPPGLGALPLFPVESYAARLPAAWRERGGVFIPLYQREALWIGFRSTRAEPRAVKVAVGGFNVLSGQRETGRLDAHPQDYLVCPPQIWLDGVRTERGSVRQFVAVPLGQGLSLEATLGGAELRGGIQLTVFRPLPGAIPEPELVQSAAPARARSLGFGLGGAIQQKIYPDPHGIEVWDVDSAESLDVHALSSLEFRLATGIEPPPTPIDAQTYAERGLPWFELYDETLGDLAVADALRGATTLAE
ncbi:MAG TPA: hypothetical protein VMG12_26495 [Polyangiaceae bacterium]|nr:hypothetical protein [Polyangiaceae bacterium]